MAFETVRFPSNIDISGNLTYHGTLSPPLLRSSLAQDDFQCYPIPWTAWRVFDAFGTNLPATSANDDLGISGGTYGTGCPYLTTGDVKTTTVSRKARAVVALPPEYVAGQSVRITISGGMKTTVADTSATVDVSAYKLNREGAVDGADLVTTTATTINSLTFGDKSFDVTATSLNPGDQLDVQLTVAVVDGASGTAVEAALGSIDLVVDIKG